MTPFADFKQEDLQDMVDFAFANLREQVIGKSVEGLMPRLYVFFKDYDEDEQFQVCLCMLDAPDFREAKARMMLELGKMCARQEWLVYAVVLVSEAWVVRSQDRNMKTLPSEHPDREEMAIVIGDSYTDLNALRMMAIERDQKGTISDLQELTPPEMPKKSESPLLIKYWFGYCTELANNLPLELQPALNAYLNRQ